MIIVAHRGASGAHPEQTRHAFHAALAAGADAVECDVRLTRDGTLVCLHDPIIDRVSDGHGRVSQFTYPELCRYNFGTEDDPQLPMRFDDLLVLLAEYPEAHLFVETKHPTRYGRMLEEQVVLRLCYHGLDESPRVHVISFSPQAMLRFRQLAPALDRIHLRDPRWGVLGDRADNIGQPSGVGFSLDEARSHPKSVARARRPIYLWTANTPEEIRAARDLGATYLATDHPSLAARVLAEPPAAEPGDLRDRLAHRRVPHPQP